MITLHLPVAARRLAGGLDRLELAGPSTLGEILDEADRRHPGLRAAMVEGAALRPGLAVAIDGEIGSGALFEPLADGAEVHLVPALGGGLQRRLDGVPGPAEAEPAPATGRSQAREVARSSRHPS